MLIHSREFLTECVSLPGIIQNSKFIRCNADMKRALVQNDKYRCLKNVNTHFAPFRLISEQAFLGSFGHRKAIPDLTLL